MSRDTWSKWHRIYSVNLILYKSSDLKPLSPLEVLGEFAKNRFGKNFPVAVYILAVVVQHCLFMTWSEAPETAFLMMQLK